VKFKKFMDKIPKDGQIECTDLLFHAVDALDEAILAAVESKNIDKIESLYGLMMDASDRLISLGMEEEEPKKDDTKPRIGFDTSSKPHTIESES
jgi:hypothetical protein